MLNPNFFLEHHEFYRQNYIKWKIENLPTDPRKLLKVYRKQDYSFDWPHDTVDCWLAQSEADLWNFTPENEYFDGVNPVIQTNGSHPNNISFKYKQNTAVCHCN